MELFGTEAFLPGSTMIDERVHRFVTTLQRWMWTRSGVRVRRDQKKLPEVQKQVEDAWTGA